MGRDPILWMDALLESKNFLGLAKKTKKNEKNELIFFRKKRRKLDFNVDGGSVTFG